MSSRSKKVLILQPVLGQPIYTKRINMLLEHGHDVRIAAFDRPFNSTASPEHEIVVLGRIEHQKYLQRVPKLLIAGFKLRSLLKECDVVYAFGTDLIMLSILAGVGLKCGRILETVDVTELQTRQSFVGSMARKLDSFICSRLDYLVVTAPLFLDRYFREWIGTDTSAIVMENKLTAEQVDDIKIALATKASDSPNPNLSTSIGYFGLLQSRWSWRVLKLLAKEHPQTHNVLIAGFSMHLDDLEETVQSTDNISYFGKYKSQKDRHHIYTSINMSWACFSPIDAGDWNLRWARSNRLYEACAYETPLISREGSDLAADVVKYDIGLVIDDADEQAAVEKLAAVTPEQIAAWKKNMQALPRKVYTYTDESAKLSQAIVMSSPMTNRYTQTTTS